MVRDLFRLKAKLFEHRGIADGVVYREMAQLLLRRRVFDPISVGICASLSQELRRWVKQPVSAAVAERCLRRLTDHPFTSWSENFHAAVASLAPTPANPASTPLQPTLVATPPMTGQAVEHTLEEGLAVWRLTKRITGENQTADEFATAVARFGELAGVTDVGLITKKMVKRSGTTSPGCPRRAGA